MGSARITWRRCMPRCQSRRLGRSKRCGGMEVWTSSTLPSLHTSILLRQSNRARTVVQPIKLPTGRVDGVDAGGTAHEELVAVGGPGGGVREEAVRRGGGRGR